MSYEGEEEEESLCLGICRILTMSMAIGSPRLIRMQLTQRKVKMNFLPTATATPTPSNEQRTQHAPYCTDTDAIHLHSCYDT